MLFSCVLLTYSDRLGVFAIWQKVSFSWRKEHRRMTNFLWKSADGLYTILLISFLTSFQKSVTRLLHEAPDNYKAVSKRYLEL